MILNKQDRDILIVIYVKLHVVQVHSKGTQISLKNLIGAYYLSSSDNGK